MQVICIETTWDSNLTINKMYDLIEEDSAFYYIKNDANGKAPYYKKRFKIVDMKPKLNLNGTNQNWCVKSSDNRLLQYLGKRYKNNIKHFQGGTSHYGVRFENKNYTDCSNISWGIEYTLEEFLTALAEYENPWQPKVGDLVEVSVNNVTWHKYYFVARLSENQVCCSPDSVTSLNNMGYVVSNWPCIRKIEPKVEISIKCTINGKETNPCDLTEQEWLNLRKAK